MTISRLTGLALIVLLAACTGGGGETAAPAEKPAADAETAAPALTSEQAETVKKAAAAARAVKADPDRAEEVLEEHGFTPEAFDDLLYEIASDPALSRAYRTALEAPAS